MRLPRLFRRDASDPITSDPATAELAAQVERVLRSVRPVLMRDGGNVTVRSIEGDTVRLKWSGACVHCPISSVTLQMTLEQAIKREFPQIKRVVAS